MFTRLWKQLEKCWKKILKNWKKSEKMEIRNQEKSGKIIEKYSIVLVYIIFCQYLMKVGRKKEDRR